MTTYTIDHQHSDVGFSVRHMVFAKVRGHFTKWTADVAFDPVDMAKSSLNVEIDAASIDTRAPQRDGHLKSPDFLDTEKYPKLVYKSTKVEEAGDKKYTVTGDLTIRGVTRPVRLEVEELGGGKDPWGNQRIAFAAKSRIDRGDFGLKWNQALETGGVLVGEHIDIEIDVEAIAKP
jgi:polyisoprenoid-binding protein YceI